MQFIYGIGTTTEEWRYAIVTIFNVTNWPHIHSEVIMDCVKGFFSDSFRNLSQWKCSEGWQPLLDSAA